MGKLILENITKMYPDGPAVDKVNISINSNELATIVGPSGCGKTTTLRMVAGFILPTEGRISIDGSDLVDRSKKFFLQPEKRDIGMVFQTYAVWPHMNVFNNVAYPLKIRKIDKNVIREKTEATLKVVGLHEYISRHPHELSGGQQQRVALARALIMEPKVLLLDEPLSNLDAALREQMRSEIKEIQRRMGVTIVNVTHDQVEAMSMSDKVIVMKKGKLIQMGSPRDLYENPTNSFVAKFIGSANVLRCERFGNDSKNIMNISVFGEPMQVSKKTTKGNKGFVAVRPQDIVFAEEAKLRGKVIRKLYLGYSIEYYISINDEIIRVMSDTKYDFNIDDNVGLLFKKGVWIDN